MSEERSENGDPIYRYKEPSKEWTPPDMSNSSLEAIEDHIEAHVGKVDTVWHEVISDHVHIDVHVVKPTVDRPYYTLITSGMSDLPMKAPLQAQDYRFAELMMSLPADWPMSQEAWKDTRHYWPIYWLKVLSRFPHKYDTWLSYGHTMPNGNPSEPVAPNAAFECMLLGPPMTVSTDFWRLKVSADKTISFFAVFPIYPEEAKLKLKKGADELFTRFEKSKITELLDIRRRNVAKSEWWRLF